MERGERERRGGEDKESEGRDKGTGIAYTTEGEHRGENETRKKIQKTHAHQLVQNCLFFLFSLFFGPTERLKYSKLDTVELHLKRI